MDQQVLFLEGCKDRRKTSNFAQELADLLGLNADAAYRRLRGATPLTFNEIKKISQSYNISFDSIINYEGRTVPFQFNSMFQDEFRILHYLKEIDQHLMRLSMGPDSKVSMTAMDLPYFRQFGFPSLRRFKLFYWQRSVLNLEEFRQLKFDTEHIVPEFEEITLQIYKHYHALDSTEIWAPETLDSTLKQIQYYLDSGLFTSLDSAISICDDLEKLLDKLEQEAQLATKILNIDGESYSSNFSMYQSDIFLSNNSIQAYGEDRIYTYVSFNSFNSLMSYAPTFSEECRRWIEQIRLKSILLSEVSEKHRFQFFRGLRNKIRELRDSIVKSV